MRRRQKAQRERAEASSVVAAPRSPTDPPSARRRAGDSDAIWLFVLNELPSLLLISLYSVQLLAWWVPPDGGGG